jgi:hypothetical protein
MNWILTLRKLAYLDMGEDTNLIVIKEIHLQGPSNPHPPNAMLSPGQSAYPVKHSAD